MFKKISVIAAKSNAKAIAIKDKLVAKYGFFDLTLDHQKFVEFDLVVAVGGDGLMLHLMHEFKLNPPLIYGVNCGTVGFLMNSFEGEDFLQKLSTAKPSLLNPLRMEALDISGQNHSFIAINEVSLLRQTSQTTQIAIEIDGKNRLSSLVADGVLISTSAGSTAYNFSVGGPIIPMGSNVLALTAISPFRPRKWCGALVPIESKVKFSVIDPKKRPTSATADYREIRNISEVLVSKDSSISFQILFDESHSLEERIMREQFIL